MTILGYYSQLREEHAVGLKRPSKLGSNNTTTGIVKKHDRNGSKTTEGAKE